LNSIQLLYLIVNDESLSLCLDLNLRGKLGEGLSFRNNLLVITLVASEPAPDSLQWGVYVCAGGLTGVFRKAAHGRLF